MFLAGLRTTERGVDRESVTNRFRKDFDLEIKDARVADRIDPWIRETGAA